MNETIEQDEIEASLSEELCEVDIILPPSPVLARLIEEVRNEEATAPTAYNRMHNRHNRSR